MGAWIEIKLEVLAFYFIFGRTPRWVRGLKYVFVPSFLKVSVSHPTMGAWIEIYIPCNVLMIRASRTPRWVRGLKYHRAFCTSFLQVLSHPTMGAWIEIILRTQIFLILHVAPHDGCVD